MSALQEEPQEVWMFELEKWFKGYGAFPTWNKMLS